MFSPSRVRVRFCVLFFICSLIPDYFDLSTLKTQRPEDEEQLRVVVSLEKVYECIPK